jgi:hypothetical protein
MSSRAADALRVAARSVFHGNESWLWTAELSEDALRNMGESRQISGIADWID